MGEAYHILGDIPSFLIEEDLSGNIWYQIGSLVKILDKHLAITEEFKTEK